MKITSIVLFVLVMLATTFFAMVNATEKPATGCFCFVSEKGHWFPVIDSLQGQGEQLVLFLKPHKQALTIMVDKEREVFHCENINQCEIRINRSHLQSAKTLQIMGLGHILQTLKIPN